MSTFFYLTCQGAAAIRNSSIRVPAWWCSHCSACCRCRRSLRPWRCSSWRRARWRHRRWSCRCNMHMTSAKSISNSLPTSQFHIHATCHYFSQLQGHLLPSHSVDVICTCSPLPACVGRAAVVEEGSDGEVVCVAQLHQAHLVAPHVLVHRQDRVRVAVLQRREEILYGC